MPTLDWIGKDAVVNHHQEVPFHLLREDESRAVGDPDAENLLVQGDNLLALKALLPHYAGEVKCIYIDPPYNTGNENWAYNDNVNSPEIRRWLGETVGKEAEDLSRHDKWLCMMYPRLMLLHELLAEDGSFWMSIDDNEVHHARALLDEIFGRSNFIVQITWRSRVSPANDSTFFSSGHEYILVYSKSKNDCTFNFLPRNDDQLSHYNNPDNDDRGPWNSVTYTCNKSIEERPNLYYGIKNPNTGEEIYPSKKAVWKYNKKTHLKHLQNDLIYWGSEGDAKPRLKRFLSDMDGVVPRSVFDYSDYGHTQEANRELRQILDDTSFRTVKPTRLIRKILQIATDPGDLVLDSFTGSGTTGHAVLQKNSQEASDRRFILVEMEEEVAQNVTYPRLKRAVEGYDYEGKERTELMEKSIGVRELKKGDRLYAESKQVKKQHAEEYDKIRREMDDGTFRLYGENTIEDRKEGLGSGFRYLTLGPAMTPTSTSVEEAITYEDLARHVHFAETGRPMQQNGVATPPLVGIQEGTAIYLLYGTPSGDGHVKDGNVLTRDVLVSLPEPDEDVRTRVVYGEAHRLDEQEMKERGIVFRQIPYDVRTT